MKTIFPQVHNACPDVTRLYTLSGIDSGDIDKYLYIFGTLTKIGYFFLWYQKNVEPMYFSSSEPSVLGVPLYVLEFSDRW